MENLIQQLVFLPQEILQCGGRKSILMKVLVSLCLKTESSNNERVRHKLETFEINENKNIQILITNTEGRVYCVR